MLPLLGVLIVMLGFALRLNPLIVVTVAGITSALLAGMSPMHILELFGAGFASSRSISLAFIVLPVVGLAERFGLQQRARTLISRAAGLTAGRLLLLYLFVRQTTAAFGLTSIGGVAQMVRPLIYPMAEGALMRAHGDDLTESVTEQLKANAAAADTIGVFFGEDVFVAIGAVLLITAYVDANYHLTLDALQIALWALPTAVAAFLIHGFRLLRLDGKLDAILAASRKQRDKRA
jgi:uncharacterized membrane protein